MCRNKMTHIISHILLVLQLYIFVSLFVISPLFPRGGANISYPLKRCGRMYLFFFVLPLRTKATLTLPVQAPSPDIQQYSFLSLSLLSLHLLSHRTSRHIQERALSCTSNWGSLHNDRFRCCVSFGKIGSLSLLCSGFARTSSFTIHNAKPDNTPTHTPGRREGREQTWLLETMKGGGWR